MPEYCRRQKPECSPVPICQQDHFVKQLYIIRTYAHEHHSEVRPAVADVDHLQNNEYAETTNRILVLPDTIYAASLEHFSLIHQPASLSSVGI
jgi:hypothetical protein